MRRFLRNSWRTLLAAAFLAAVTYLSYGLLARFPEFPPAQVGRGRALLAAALSSLAVAAVLSYLVVRSRWSGAQLVCAVFVAHFGLYTFIPQSEAVLIMSGVFTMPTAALLTAHGFLVAAVFSVLLVGVMGRLRHEELVHENVRLQMPAREWLWKLAVCVGVGLAVDLTVRSLLWPETMRAALPPLLHCVALMVGRSLLMVAFILPVIKMMRGDRLEVGLTVACLLAVVSGFAPLIAAHPLLPELFPLTHSLGVGGADLVFGFLVGYLFSRETRDG